MAEGRWAHLRRARTTGFWLWSLLFVLLLLMACMLVTRIFFASDALTRRAVETGQRVTVTLATGEVDGNARHTARATPNVEPSGRESVTGHVPPQAPPVPSSPVDAPRPAEQMPVASDAGTAEPSATEPVKKNASAPLAAPPAGGLAPAPFNPISEQSDKGLIPVAAKDGTVAWKYYGRPADISAKRPMVAIIFTNLGLSKPQTEKVLTLPPLFTLSFSPYAGDARLWAEKAREAGFETLIDLPMEPENYPLSDPGPYGLLTNLPPPEATARLHWVLSRFQGYVGALAPGSEKLTENSGAIRPTLTELNSRGLLFLYLKTPRNAGIGDLAKLRSLKILPVNLVLDDDISVDAIEHELAALVTAAKANGSAIAIAHSYPPTIDGVSNWAEGLSAQGVDLVPVSAIARKQFP